MTSPEGYLSTQPEHYIAYAPHECAVVYFVRGEDVYGWWIGFHDYQYPSAFFELERFFSTHPTVFYATDGQDVYGGWRYLYSRAQPALQAAVPIEDGLCHQLEQLQDSFANEWLWFRGTPGSDAEAAAYAQDEIAVEDVNVKHRHLGKLRKDAPVWTHESHGLNLDIIDYLATHWPLDYGKG